MSIITPSGKLLLAVASGSAVEGELWGAGINNSGELGDGTLIFKSSPVQVGAGNLPTNIVNVGVGSNHALALDADGKMWGWGVNTGGQLGIGNTTNMCCAVQVGSDTDWATIGKGGHANHNLSIKTDGSLYAWGVGSNGCLGLGSTTNKSVPTQVGSDTDWAVAVCDFTDSSLAIKTDGSLWAWGLNSQGKLGLNDTTARSSPVQVGAATDYLAIVLPAYLSLDWFYIRTAP